MPRKKKEFEEEQEEFEEEQELSRYEKRILRYEDELNFLDQKIRACENSPEEYLKWSRARTEVIDNIKNLEAAESENADRRASEIAMENAKEERKFRWIETGCRVGGDIVGRGLGEWIRGRFSSKNVNRITKYEEDGNVVTSKAAGFINK